MVFDVDQAEWKKAWDTIQQGKLEKRKRIHPKKKKMPIISTQIAPLVSPRTTKSKPLPPQSPKSPVPNRRRIHSPIRDNTPVKNPKSPFGNKVSRPQYLSPVKAKAVEVARKTTPVEKKHVNFALEPPRSGNRRRLVKQTDKSDDDSDSEVELFTDLKIPSPKRVPLQDKTPPPKIHSIQSYFTGQRRTTKPVEPKPIYEEAEETTVNLVRGQTFLNFAGGKSIKRTPPSHLKAKQLEKPREEIEEAVDALVPGQTLISFGKKANSSESSLFAPNGKNIRVEGLVNLGNTCYLNAVVQSLVSLKGFMDLLRDEKWLKDVREAAGMNHVPPETSTVELKEKVDLYKYFLNAIRDITAQKKDKVVVNLSDLKETIGKRTSVFIGNAQQDAHELLLNIVDELTQDMKRYASEYINLSSKSISYQLMARSEGPDKENLDLHPVLPTTSEFYVELNRKLTCEDCQYSRNILETFRALSLDLPAAKIVKCKCNQIPKVLITKKEGLNHGRAFYKCERCSFFQWQSVEEPLSLDRLFNDTFKDDILELKCDNCPTGTRARAIYQVKTLSNVLILHLKRFQATLEKRMDPVCIPTTLDPNTWNTSTSFSTFTLRNVIHHKGRTAGSGHYVTDVRKEDATWTRYDDSIVQDLDSETVKGMAWHETAYILFYERQVKE